MLFSSSRLAHGPISYIPVIIALLSGAGVLAGCLTTAARSTGAVLPQASEKITTDIVVVDFDHNCSDGRCSGLDATFLNLLDEELEVRVADSKITRAGESLALVHDEKIPKQVISVPPRGKVSASFLAVSSAKVVSASTPKGSAHGKQIQMTYVRPKEVWCSLKVDSACSNSSAGEAECAAAARTYYQQYVDLKGWIDVSFAVKPKSAKKFETVRNEVPRFMGVKPPVELAAEGDSPFWYGLNSQHTVFYRFVCDEKCACSSLEAARDFVVDDKFLPVEQK
jgi:hypothetical protein